MTDAGRKADASKKAADRPSEAEPKSGLTTDPNSAENRAPVRSRIHLRYLEVFYQVVVQGSMSDAARAMGLTQPTVSGHILQLEKDLGIDLLDRSHGRARPTTAGELLFRHAEVIHRDKQAAESDIESFLGIRTGKILVGGSTTPATYHLPSRLARFAADHPQIDVQMVTGTSNAVLRRLEDSELDLAVLGRTVSSDRLNSRPLAEDCIVLVVGRGHPWWKRSSCEPAELPDLKFLAREPGSATLTSVERELSDHKVAAESLPVLLRLPTNEAVREGLKSGSCAGFLPQVCVEGRADEFHVVEIKGLKIARTMTVVWPKSPERTPPARKFLDEYLRA